MPHIALLGAGFSRNWGGWLAPEAFEYLLGCPQVDADIRNLLWQHRRAGGFEDALAQLQAEYTQRRDPATEERLARLQGAVRRMFMDMDAGFAAIGDFEPQNSRPYLVRSFLVRFDAIFTLNQDLLIERHYLNGNVSLAGRDWTGWEIPGMQPLPGQDAANPADATWSPLDPMDFRLNRNLQPYFKLHGSSNWIDGSGDRQLLVMGGNKPATIEQHPILLWNHKQFSEYLSAPDTRLMVVGYSFGDHHINNVILNAARRGHLRLFIIDPCGADVIDKNRHVPIYFPDPLVAGLGPCLIGASRRGVREIFGTDRVEHAKVMRFFSDG